MREAINLSDSTKDVVMKMAEGNPGAISVLTQLLNSDDPAALMLLLDLDDMNIRGSQIWVGYKDHCGEDLEKFTQAIRDRDRAMVDAINAECWRIKDGYREQAVTGGASFNHVAGQRPDVRGIGS